jgi:hypothetical protein
MDSVKYLRHAAAIGGSNTDNDDYFCPVTIRRAFEIAHEIEDLRAKVEVLEKTLERALLKASIVFDCEPAAKDVIDYIREYVKAALREGDV